jgi:hypothetical protein
MMAAELVASWISMELGLCDQWLYHTLARILKPFQRTSKATTFIAFWRIPCPLTLLIACSTASTAATYGVSFSTGFSIPGARSGISCRHLVNHTGSHKRICCFLGVTLQWLREWFEARCRREFLGVTSKQISVQEISHSRILSKSSLSFHMAFPLWSLATMLVN